MKFKIGDRVKIINPNSKFYGFIGTVVKTALVNDYYMLCFYDHYEVSFYKYGPASKNFREGRDKFTHEYGPYSARDLKLISKLTYKPEDYVDTDEIKAKATLNYVYGMTGDYGRGITQMSHKNSIPEIRNVYFNNPLTCVIWKDGTKTFVKNADGDNNYDPEKALAMAIAKKALGNKYDYHKEFKKWLPEEEKASTKNPVEKAYLTLLKVNDDPTSKTDDFTASIEEAIGYLGEALDN